ncbi:hypothetical protein [Pedobacter fastidiosus]|uniref:hypothetical protein n=1 Tax=Pedobacter fastidiosus TaxID=2765361 RepID=UPI00164D5BB7|nr:hypothetical protein [Pedobacter fastidiosus]
MHLRNNKGWDEDKENRLDGRWNVEDGKQIFVLAGRALFFLMSKRKQKTPAENFSIKVSALALPSYAEKFVRPD